MTLCNSCGQDNKKNVKFCSKCGTKIEDIEIEPKSKHDMDLGKLHPEWIPKKQPKPEFPTSFSYRGMNRYKSEGTTLALSLFIGLLGFMGVGHRYVGNVKRSLIILGIGYGVGFLWFSHLVTLITVPSLMLNSSTLMHPFLVGFFYNAYRDPFWSEITSIVSPLFFWFTIAVPVGYYIFLIWQIFNARKQCRKFNLHMDETGAQFWEVTNQWKILYRVGLISPILAGVVLWFIVFASNMLYDLFYNLFG